MLYLNNFLGMFEAHAVNSKIVPAALNGVYKATGAKASSRALCMPSPGKIHL